MGTITINRNGKEEKRFILDETTDMADALMWLQEEGQDEDEKIYRMTEVKRWSDAMTAAKVLKAKIGGGGTVAFKVGEKGGLSVYGLQRNPVTLYIEQWERLLSDNVQQSMRAFMAENAAKFVRKSK